MKEGIGGGYLFVSRGRKNKRKILKEWGIKCKVGFMMGMFGFGIESRYSGSLWY